MDKDKATTIKTVRKEIRHKIRPWFPFNTEPPFDIDELVLMAILLANKPMSMSDIFHQITKTFVFYGRLANRYACGEIGIRPSPGRRQDSQQMLQLRYGLTDTLNDFDIPFKLHGSAAKKTWTIGARQGRKALGDVLGNQEPERAGHFNFFGLPAEIRMTIYEMVFSYPKSGVWVCSLRGRNRFRLETRSYDEPFDFSSWESNGGNKDDAWPKLRQRAMSEVLAPLLTCRQFYSEAMPTFYSNRFIAHDLTTLKVMLDTVGMARIRHFTHISVTYCLGEDLPMYSPDDTRAAWNVFKALPELKSLKKLDLRIQETSWLDKGHGRPVKKYQTVSNIPGLKFLRRSPQLERITLCGPCPDIKAMLEQAVQERKQRMVARSAEKCKRTASHVEELEEVPELKRRRLE